MHFKFILISVDHYCYYENCMRYSCVKFNKIEIIDIFCFTQLFQKYNIVSFIKCLRLLNRKILSNNKKNSLYVKCTVLI